MPKSILSPTMQTHGAGADGRPSVTVPIVAVPVPAVSVPVKAPGLVRAVLALAK